MTSTWDRAEWTQVQCYHCSGHGLVASFNNYPEPEECRYCFGSGSLWRSPRGRLASYPEGPFVGRES